MIRIISQEGIHKATLIILPDETLDREKIKKESLVRCGDGRDFEVMRDDCL